MEEKFSGQVDQLLHRYEEHRSEYQKRLDEEAREADAFLAEFANFRANVAYPLFKTVADHLRQHGHDCELEQPDQDVSDYGRVKHAKITLTIFPAGQERYSRPIHEFPSLSIIALKEVQMVRIDRDVPDPRRSVPQMPRGEFKLKQLTAEIVQRELLKLLGDVFGMPRT